LQRLDNDLRYFLTH